jgi:succinate dehydrogenase / fumarate reductase membrane anchor subunit
LGHVLAKKGTGHWWAQRLSAVALIPLSLWFVFALTSLDSLEFSSVTAWISEPLNAVLLILMLTTMLYHSLLGLQAVVEDYVHTKRVKVMTLMAFKYIHIGLCVAGVYAVIIVGTA